jgi:hypothetical protein
LDKKGAAYENDGDIQDIQKLKGKSFFDSGGVVKKSGRDRMQKLIASQE